MKLEFGCGETPRKANEGYLGVDIRKIPNITYVCNAWQIDQYVTQCSVTHIYSRHFLEHLTWDQADLTYSAWFKILVPGGEVEIIVPNMEWHVQQWLHPERKTHRSFKGASFDEHNAKAGFWGHQRGDLTDTWDVHKSGYDFPLLKDYLEKHNFIDIKRIKDKPKHLHITCKKPG